MSPHGSFRYLSRVLLMANVELTLVLFYRLMCETVRYERHEANEVLY